MYKCTVQGHYSRSPLLITAWHLTKSIQFQQSSHKITLFEIFIFLSKSSALISREKLSKKKLGEKLVKMLGFCQNWIFRQKFDFSNSVILIDLRLGLYAVVEPHN